VILGDEAEVIDLDSWRPVHEVRCLGKWDFTPVYPFADVKSLYCTDGFVVVATPGECRLISAPCGVSFHVGPRAPGGFPRGIRPPDGHGLGSCISEDPAR
jgi:hypothetical protein